MTTLSLNVLPLPTCLTGLIPYLLYVGSAFCHFFVLQYSVLFSVALLCAILAQRSPSLLHTSLGCSWFVLRYSPSSRCKAKIVPPRLLVFPAMLDEGRGVNATRTLVYDKDRPLQPHSSCRFMSFSCVCSSSAAVLFVSLLSKPVFVSIYLSFPHWRHPCFSFYPCLLLLSDQ